MKRRSRFSQSGLTLVELMIALALGTMVGVAIIQVLVSNRFTNDLNNSIASAQENGRFIITRMRDDILMTGYYNTLDPDLNDAQDIVEEGAFVRNNQIPLPGTFIARPALGASEGIDSSSDTLVIARQGLRDCRGFKLGYLDPEEFFVVNEYFLDSNMLKCRGFDGRVLRGQKVAEGHSAHQSVTLMENVESFQVMYGITDPDALVANGNPARYIDASQLAAALADNAYVVAIKIALIIKGDGDGFVKTPATFKLLDEDTITAPDKGLYKAFETTITLRNAHYFARSSS